MLGGLGVPGHDPLGGRCPLRQATYQRPYDALCNPQVQANALALAAEVKTNGEVHTPTRVVPLAGV